MLALVAHVVAWNHNKQNVGSFFLCATPCLHIFKISIQLNTLRFSSDPLTHFHIYAWVQPALHEFKYRPTRTI